MDVMLDALEVILNNNLITERQTLLTARLVCRAWKTMEAFSGRIISVTLYRLADVQLAARLFPRGNADNRPFPNLSTLRIPHSLSLELSRCRDAVSWFDACDPFEIQILKTDLNGFMQVSLFYKEIGTVRASLDLVTDEPSVQQLEESIQGVCTLTGLTRLSIVDTQSLDLRAWSTICLALTTCSTIQHLQLEGVCLSTSADAFTFLALVSKLPQVTQLDLSLKSKLSSKGGVEAMEMVVRKFAPSPLSHCKLNMTWEEEGDASYAVSKEFFKAGHVQTSLARAKAEFDDSSSFSQAADSHLLKALAKGPAPKRLELIYEVEGEIPVEEFLIDVSAAAGSLEELMIDVVYFHDDEDMSDFQDVRGPAFKFDPGLQLGITKLDLKFNFCGFDQLLDPSPMLRQLPLLCTQLQHLEIDTVTCCCSDTKFLTQLTKLTHLTFRNCNDPDQCWIPLGIRSFMPSLMELVIDAEDLGPSALLGLEHLTKLVVYAREARQTFERVYECDAPLKYLGLHEAPRHVHLSKIASSFPTLETLDVDLKSVTEIRCLSDLKILRKIKLKLPEKVWGGVYWLQELTSIQVLTVQNNNTSVTCFKAFEQLTQLRSLTYKAFSGWSYGPSHEVPQDLVEAVKKLRKKLPYTQISAFSKAVPVTDAMLKES